MIIASYVWWISMAHAGTMISALLLMVNRGWRNSLNRFAEAMTVFAVIQAGLSPILHLGRPWLFYWLIPYPNTMTVWPQFKSPLEWDMFGVLHLSDRLGAVLVHRPDPGPRLGARPRRAGGSPRSSMACSALGWRNSARHWQRWQITYWIAGRARRAAGRDGRERRQPAVRGRHRAWLAHHDLSAVLPDRGGRSRASRSCS